LASKADPIFRGSKRASPTSRLTATPSKADPIFRGSKPAAKSAARVKR